MERIVVTPINLQMRNPRGNTLKARTDYLREQVKFRDESNTNPKWDDSLNNNAEVGDKFAFVQNTTDIMEIFTIIGIIDAADRPNYWDIPEHQQRRLLILSHKEDEISFEAYKDIHEYNQNFIVRGTTRMKWNL
tara:strand:- start:30 stop:431 length:402 start_codon:yes stop_codon:yes gene_type:complete